MTDDHAAPLKPSSRRIWIVRWIREDGTETRHRVYLQRFSAQRFLTTLLDHGRTAGMFSTPATWEEES